MCPAEPVPTPPEPSELPEPAGVAAFRAAHAARGGTGRPVRLPASARTAALAAAALGCEVGAIANSLLFQAVRGAAQEPVLVLTSGAHRVDVEHVARVVGADRLRRATPEQVRAATGQVIGGVSPLGHPAPVATWVDTALAAHPRLWAAAGHPAWVVDTTYDELLHLTGGTPTSVVVD